MKSPGKAMPAVPRSGALVATLLVASWICATPAAAQYAFGACEPEEVWRATVREWSANGFRVQGIGRGLGFAVGWSDEEIWIATPAHVAYGEAENLSLAEVMAGRKTAWRRLEVRRLDGTGGVLALCDGERSLKGFGAVRRQAPARQDVAFVCVRRPPGLYLQSELPAARVLTGDEYRMLGTAEHPPPEELSGHLSWAADDDDRHLELRPGSGELPEKGLSGAMVVTPAGLAGLYLGWSDRGSALGVEELRHQAGDRELPWSLRPRPHYDCTATRDVCFTVVSPLRPRALVVESRNVRTIVEIDDRAACTALAEGRYSLDPQGGRVRCEPIAFGVPGGEGALSTEVRCRADLSATWSAGALGELLCTQGLFGSAQCTGLAGFGRGVFSGTLQGEGPRIELAGSFRSTHPTPVRGELDWEDGSLVGEIELIGAGTDPIRIILRPVP